MPLKARKPILIIFITLRSFGWMNAVYFRVIRKTYKKIRVHLLSNDECSNWKDNGLSEKKKFPHLPQLTTISLQI